jgi:hypothetical protein
MSPSYKSSDMGLVAYLRHEGYEPQEIVWEDDMCKWVFFHSAGLSDAIDEYARGTAIVEPKKYNSFFAKVKRETYQASNGS